MHNFTWVNMAKTQKKTNDLIPRKRLKDRHTDPISQDRTGYFIGLLRVPFAILNMATTEDKPKNQLNL